MNKKKTLKTTLNKPKNIKLESRLTSLESKHKEIITGFNNLKNTMDRSVGKSYGDYRAEQDHNANMFVASVLNPFKYDGVRKPDLTMAPTATFKDVFRTTIGTASMTDTTHVGGALIQATCNGQLHTVNSGSSRYSFTFSSQTNSPNYGYITGAFSAIRTISCGVEFVNFGTLKDRGCICAMGLVNNEMTVTDIDAFLNSPNVKIIDMNSDDNKIVWLPINTAFHNGSQNFALLSEWHEPSLSYSETANIEQVIVILFWNPTAGLVPSDSIELNIITNYEGVPLQANKRNHELKAAVGGQESIANAWNKATDSQNGSGSVLDMITDAGKTAAKSIAHAVISDPQGVVKFGKKAWNAVSKYGSQFLKSGLPLLGESLLFADKYPAVWARITSSNIALSPRDPIIRELANLDLVEQAKRIESMVKDQYRSIYINNALKVYYGSKLKSSTPLFYNDDEIIVVNN